MVSGKWEAEESRIHAMPSFQLWRGKERRTRSQEEKPSKCLRPQSVSSWQAGLDRACLQVVPMPVKSPPETKQTLYHLQRQKVRAVGPACVQEEGYISQRAGAGGLRAWVCACWSSS